MGGRPLGCSFYPGPVVHALAHLDANTQGASWVLVLAPWNPEQRYPSKKNQVFFFFLAALGLHGLSLVAASRGHSLLRCAGFSLRGLLVAEHGL